MINFEKRILEKIKQKTNLNDYGAFLYKKVVDSTSPHSNIVIYTNVIHYLQDLFYREEKQKTPNKEINFKDFRKEANEAYEWIMKILEEEKLINYIKSENGRDYPRIIGYNYFDDREFYIPTRTKGEKEWNKRYPTSQLKTRLDITRVLSKGQEICSDEITSSVLN